MLDETNQRLEVLSWLTEENLVEIDSHQEEHSRILDPGLVRCLVEHLTYLRNFNNINPVNAGQVIDMDEKNENLSPGDYEIADSFEKNTIEITRWLTSDKDSFKYLSSINLGSSGVPSFLEAAKDLRKLYVNKLITPVEEELSRERELEEIEAKLKKSRAEEAENTERVNNLKRQREEGKKNKDAVIKELKSNIEKAEREFKEQTEKITRKNKFDNDKLKKEYDAKEKEYTDTQEKLKEQLVALRLENKKSEEEMIRTKQKLQSNKIEVTIKEYDKEMIENHVQLERETKAYNENKEALEMLEEHIRQLRMEKERIEEESKREALKAKNFESLQNQKELASAYIASHWKGLKARQEYEKQKKSKKKRGKKGK